MTDRAVVDTNVLVAANGRDTHVEESCQLRCVEELARLAREELAREELAREEVVCVDDRWLIMREYENRTRQTGQPRPGTVFYKHVCRKMGDWGEEATRKASASLRSIPGTRRVETSPTRFFHRTT